jgi:hypothetical protein
VASTVNSKDSFINGRGSHFCRGCLGESLFSALDLGFLSIANELLVSNHEMSEVFPLHLKICEACGLGQVEDVVTPERIFKDYRYLSSISSTFLEHAARFVDLMTNTGVVTKDDWVLEIASNDGYLLKNFLDRDIKVLGVEPANNVAAIGEKLGIPTIVEFFSSALAREILETHGYPKLIIANNVMAHVPDLHDFLKGISILCGADTLVSVENPSLDNILSLGQFDTIYHEHYSYLSCSSVAKLGEFHELELCNVESLLVHGGSNRYWLRKKSNSQPIEKIVEVMRDAEREKGLFDPMKWLEYRKSLSVSMAYFREWLESKAASGSKIYGYGAAAKASTYLNYANSHRASILGIADASLEKQGRYISSHAIHIISPELLKSLDPSDVIIFPWNIKSEISKSLRDLLGEHVNLWCLVPNIERVE